MKVVCNNLTYVSTCIDNLTIGKIYSVLDIHPGYFGDYNLYNIINDEGNPVLYNSKLFISLDEWRDLKLDNILNNY